MAASEQPTSTSNVTVWIGRVISALPVLMLLMSATMKFMKSPEVLKGFADWPANVALGIGIAELVSTILYIIPQSSVLGAILLTGYLGGAIATHVRLGESILIPALLGVLVWLGLYLRDARLRALIPLRHVN